MNEDNHEDNHEYVHEDVQEDTPWHIFHREVTRWHSDIGDLTHRLNYNELNKDSFVLDIGGFRGEWASDIYSKYLCQVHVYEPINEYFTYIHDRFLKNSNISVFKYGFSNIERTAQVSVNSESTSLYIDNNNMPTETIEILNFNKYISSLHSDIDLVKINIEGSEYDLLESIDNTNIKKIKNIQIQFHIFVNDCMERKNKIRERLALTHECTYCYEFVWENWRLKNE